ncbi:hypothetical protein [Vibrio sp. TRT 29B02]|uniref:hypothetical protein n=1 Tax=Vibrio sp. TRT 29B02 TaxID=3418508 RepID=UPI003CF94BFD
MEKRKVYSEQVVTNIRTKLNSCLKDDPFSSLDISVIVNGSFGRNEASEVSDMDWFIVAKSKLDSSTTEQLRETVHNIVTSFVPKNCGNTGTFGGVVTEDELLENFGGDVDTNQKFTRRMLLLLESKWLFNEELYSYIKNEVLSKYIKEGVPDSGLNRFILNDVIRYYRTICTDYEYKVYEDGKKWGVRKIKLRFSRKLLYFSGLLTVADTASLSRNLKIEKTASLLDLSPIDRIIKILGESETSKMMEFYYEFLDKISEESIRNSLDSVERENRNENDDYRYLKNLSEHFNWEMEKCFYQKFPPSHPIHAAMIF